ncbi:hypothetical protein [Candidatus Uabimicrobium sp. HlEnr_7]|uniref:hypothetical protein n=1 Tax=Candidatus Uabimicrobium helgolandensis TaxID=3095367 RepID=UPI003557CF39
MRTFLICAIFLLCSCVEKQDTNTLEDVQSRNTPTNSSLKIVVLGEKIDEEKKKYDSEESVEISFATGVYTYTWQRQADKVTLLGDYTFSNDENTTKFLSLKDFSKDTDWFIITSNKPLGLSKSKIRNLAKSIPITENSSALKPYTWRIYNVEDNLKNINIQANIDIFHTPFSFEIMSKNANEESFQPQRKQKLKQSSQLNLQFKMFQERYFSIFICSISSDKVISVSQIFPENNNKVTQLLPHGFEWKKTIKGAIKPNEENNEHWIYCFNSDQKLDNGEIKQWLSTKARGFDAVVSLTTGEITPIENEEVLGEANNIIKVEEKDFPHIKIGLQ